MANALWGNKLFSFSIITTTKQSDDAVKYLVELILHRQYLTGNPPYEHKAVALKSKIFDYNEPEEQIANYKKMKADIIAGIKANPGKEVVWLSKNYLDKKNIEVGQLLETSAEVVKS